MRPDQPDRRSGQTDGVPPAPQAPPRPHGARIVWQWWLAAALFSVFLWWLIIQLVS